MSDPGSTPIDHLHLTGSQGKTRHAPVVVEEPLEIRLNGSPIAVTMRTPGHDIELALGFLITEGVVQDSAAVQTVAHCDENQNVVDVRTEPDAPGVRHPEKRNFFASSSCGLCGKASIDAVRTQVASLADDRSEFSASILCELPQQLRQSQRLFEATGSLHAAGLFSSAGEMVCLREDVGRHNAVDKTVGWATARESLPLRRHALLVSGRVSFEIVQKALMARIPLLAAISGPSTLAIELARENSMTLVGFLRGDEMNVYSGAERITLGA